MECTASLRMASKKWLAARSLFMSHPEKAILPTYCQAHTELFASFLANWNGDNSVMMQAFRGFKESLVTDEEHPLKDFLSFQEN